MLGNPFMVLRSNGSKPIVRIADCARAKPVRRFEGLWPTRRLACRIKSHGWKANKARRAIEKQAADMKAAA
jgi:hypothetical protein